MNDDTEIVRRKKAQIGALPESELSEFVKAAELNTVAGLRKFLERHNAIIERRSLYKIRFPKTHQQPVGE